MEFMQCDPSTRDFILEQLRKRELFVANAESLPLQKLQEIYNGFILPQPRREQRERRERQRPRAEAEAAAEAAAEAEAATTTKLLQHNLMPMEMEKLMKRIKVVYVVGEKRHKQLSEEFALENYTCASKRLRSSQEWQ